MLHRYWFEFAFAEIEKVPGGTKLGCGVTAHSCDDAFALVRGSVFEGNALPEIVRFIEDIDVSTLDQNHVLPNMGLVTKRGIWFPLGYG